MLKLLLLAIAFKTVIQIESCANSGRCRVYFDDNSTDLLYNPYIGMRVEK